MNYKIISFIKILLLAVALGVVGFLAFFDRSNDIAPDQKIVFVVDTHLTMNTKDILSGTQTISRLTAAKELIKTMIFSEPQFSYGLIIFNAGADYIVPPTFDTWTFLLYLSGITTNLLPDGVKNLAQLSWFFRDCSSTRYVVLSDLSQQEQRSLHLSTCASFLPIADVTHLTRDDLSATVFGGSDLPISQRIFLYSLLGILVILVVFL